MQSNKTKGRTHLCLLAACLLSACLFAPHSLGFLDVSENILHGFQVFLEEEVAQIRGKGDVLLREHYAGHVLKGNIKGLPRWSSIQVLSLATFLGHLGVLGLLLLSADSVQATCNAIYGKEES